MNKLIQNSTEYFQKGEKPSLLILSGTHGDEFKVIESVTSFIKDKYENLPSFLFIPAVSPSAVKQKTRVNVNGVDLNRIFKGSIQDKEAIAIQTILNPFHFKISLSFHEDPENESFYMYDSGLFEPEQLQVFKDLLHTSNVLLFSGIDDSEDPLLGLTIQEGYYSVNPKYDYSDGYLMDYVIQNKICERFITLEIPGKVSQEENLRITSAVMNSLREVLIF
jgi:hypothetical protein